MKVQVLGLCRFSFTGLGAFQREHETIAERQAALFDPKRLRERLTWFEHVTLPPLRAQTDPAFTLLVLTGTDLPGWARQRLDALLSDLPQARLVAHEPAPSHATANAVLQAAVDGDADLIAQFRMDDDDAVAVDFVERLRRDAAIPAGLVREARPVALDYTRGMVLSVQAGSARLVPRFAQYWTPGLAVLFRPRARHALMNFRHNRLWQSMTTLTQQDSVMWLRGHHGSNDSSFPVEGPGFACDDPDSTALCRFVLNLPAFVDALRQGRG